MVKTIRVIGDGHGVVIDKAVLDSLGLKSGARVNVTLSPDGKGILLTPLTSKEASNKEASDAKAEHKARVRAAGERVMERHGSVFKKLAE